MACEVRKSGDEGSQGLLYFLVDRDEQVTLLFDPGKQVILLRSAAYTSGRQFIYTTPSV